MDGVVVVTQKAEVNAEVGNQLAEHPFTARDVVGRRGRHQFGGRRGDQIVQRAGHSPYRSRNRCYSKRTRSTERRLRTEAGPLNVNRKTSATKLSGGVRASRRNASDSSPSSSANEPDTLASSPIVRAYRKTGDIG